MVSFQQGDILKIEGYAFYVLVVSKNFFNESGRAIGCPVYKRSEEGPLHIRIALKDKETAIVFCEQVRYLDLQKRGFKKVSEISIYDLMNVSDAIQGLVECY